MREAAVALAVAGLVVAVEYLFRHYVMFWPPVLGALAVNDMLALLAAYLLLVLGVGSVLQVEWRRELAGVGQALREGLASWNFTSWVLVLVASIWALSALDRALWPDASLPMLVSAHRNPTVWLAEAAPVLKPASLLLVNGLFVPVAEEFLWRGVVQHRLVRVLPAAAAIAVTAVLFSLKHALVDASFARLLALVAFGAICGVVAYRASWRRSAALHLVVNTIVTAVGLALGPR